MLWDGEIWCISWSFVVFIAMLVYFIASLVHFPHFGMFRPWKIWQPSSLQLQFSGEDLPKNFLIFTTFCFVRSGALLFGRIAIFWAITYFAEKINRLRIKEKTGKNGSEKNSVPTSYGNPIWKGTSSFLLQTGAGVSRSGWSGLPWLPEIIRKVREHSDLGPMLWFLKYFRRKIQRKNWRF
jgi:hypothetical protein